MSIEFYKVLHITGIAMTIIALGGIIQHSINGGERSHSWRLGAAITHGVGLILVLISGFGSLARLGIHWPWPGWLFIKLFVWLSLGLMLGFALRLPKSGKILWFASILLVGLAAYAVFMKPFPG